MTRSVWKGPFVDGYLLKKADAASFGQKRSNQNLVAQIHHAAAVRRFDIWCSQWS